MAKYDNLKRLNFCCVCHVRIEASEEETNSVGPNPQDGSYQHRECPTIVWIPQMGHEFVGMNPQPYATRELAMEACDKRLSRYSQVHLLTATWRAMAVQVRFADGPQSYEREININGVLGWQMVARYVVEKEVRD